MSQSGNTIIRKTKAGPNIYSVLAIIATMALGLAFGFVAYENTQLTGEGNPFKAKEVTVTPVRFTKVGKDLPNTGDNGSTVTPPAPPVNPETPSE